MVLVRLFDTEAPDGEGMSGDFEMSTLPDVADRIALHSSEGGVAIYEVLGRTFELAFDEQGAPVGEALVTLDVERLQFEPDEGDQEQG